MISQDDIQFTIYEHCCVETGYSLANTLIVIGFVDKAPPSPIGCRSITLPL